MLDFSSLNWFAILVATIAAFVLGGLWYGPIFGEAWLKAVGKKKEDLDASPMPFVISFFCALITAIVLSAIIHTIGDVDLVGGILIGLLTSIGFIATGMASDYAFCGWGKPLYLIQSGYRVTYGVIMGAILGGWQ